MLSTCHSFSFFFFSFWAKRNRKVRIDILWNIKNHSGVVCLEYPPPTKKQPNNLLSRSNISRNSPLWCHEWKASQIHERRPDHDLTVNSSKEEGKRERERGKRIRAWNTTAHTIGTIFDQLGNMGRAWAIVVFLRSLHSNSQKNS